MNFWDSAPVPVLFPFTAVIGQDDFKLALLACAVDPAIGGVLAAGDRGTAKSTLARSVAGLLPPRSTDAAASRDGVARPRRPAPFVELPLGATVDRLTGSIDTERLLAGEGALVRPGLLATADGGVLYADEVNLLGDHLVDLLLDAAAFGRVHVERDGVSATHAARFVLVGTMNPEEGELRPQLLDRFGLSVAIDSPEDPAERAAIVDRRLAFERAPAAFAERYADDRRALADLLINARASLAKVRLTAPLLDVIARLCLLLGVEGMRGDVVTARTATALAALDARREVTQADVAVAARLALPHRVRAANGEARRLDAAQIAEALARIGPASGVDRGEAPTAMSATGRRRAQTAAGAATEPPVSIVAGGPPVSAVVGGAGVAVTGATPSREPAVAAATPVPPRSLDAARVGSAPGRRRRVTGGDRPAVDTRPPARTAAAVDLDPIATARAAMTRRIATGAAAGITADDLRERIRAGREANLVLCVVDASSSVLEGGRAAELRALLTGLVADARRKRDRVGLVVFRGREARLAAPPSRNHSAALAAIESIEPGGTTPLAEGIRVAHQTALRELRRNPDLRPVVTLVTDGYANVGRGGDAVADARAAARALLRDKIAMIVIGEPGSGARAFARATTADYFAFEPAVDRLSVA